MSTSREKLLAQFRELVTERLGRVSHCLMALENGPDVDSGRAALRELHGLKGEARMMGFAEVNTLVHHMEELVRVVEPLAFGLQAGSVDALLAASGAVGVLAGAAQGEAPDVQRLVAWIAQCVQAEAERVAREKPSAAPAPAPSAVPAPVPFPAMSPPSPLPRPSAPQGSEPGKPARPKFSERTEQSIRISHKSLEVLTSTSNSLEQRAHRRLSIGGQRTQLAWELRQLHRQAEDLGPAGAELAAGLGRVKELSSELSRLDATFAGEESRDLSVLHDEIQSLRMVPLGVLFEPYPRMVRDLAKELGREVELVIEGENEQLDRSVLEVLMEPLMHLVRNAIDHGLEPRETRLAAGKPPKGTLNLGARREGDRLVLRVEDDGRGLDAATLRAAAVRKGLLDAAGAQALGDDAALELVFLPGFSSKEQVTDVSGRGVGLDAVRTRLLAVGGEVTVETKAGKGCAFALRVPVSLALAPVLFVQLGGERVCLLASSVDAALIIEAPHLRQLAGRAAVAVDGEVLPFASLAFVLGLGPERPPTAGELVLVLRGRGHRAVLAIDRVLDERVQAILPLRGILSGLPHLSGATQMGDGALALVLAAAHVVLAAHGRERRLDAVRSRPEQARKARILVVDDSPLTRELLVSLLESTGYELVQAGNGVEALDRLSRESVDCVVTDLEMPYMDGLELTRRLKAHPMLGRLPVVIVTTRGADADRKKGMEAGADGYVAKGDLVRKDLVDVVARLMA